MPSVIGRVLLFAALLLGLVAPLAAQPKPTGEALAHWMAYAYTTRDPRPVGDLVQWFVEEKVLTTRPEMVAPATGFLSVFFRAHPDRVEGWIAPARAGDDMTRATLAWALWIAGRTDLARGLSLKSDVRLDGEPPDLATTRPTSPLEIDMQWGAFFADGDPTHVHNVIEALDPSERRGADRKADEAALRAAAWSLAANVAAHETVARAVEREIALRPPERRAILEKIVAEAKAHRRGFPDADGEFSAMLIIGDQSQAAEFAKPHGQAPKLSLIGRAKTDQKVFVKAVFTGPAVDGRQECRVVWDVTITDPTGKPWSGADLKNLEALKGRIANRFDVFDARGFPTLWFEASDAPGVYTIVAEIRDEIGGKKLTLTRTIEYVK